MAGSTKPSDGHPRQFKRGQRVEYTYAGGKVVPGVIVRYQDMSAVPGRPDLRGHVGWYEVRLTDDAGTYGGGCHESQLRLIDNRADSLAARIAAAPDMVIPESCLGPQRRYLAMIAARNAKRDH